MSEDDAEDEEPPSLDDDVHGVQKNPYART